MDDILIIPFSKLYKALTDTPEKKGLWTKLKSLITGNGAGLEPLVVTRKLAFVVGHEFKAQGAYGVDPIFQTEYMWSKALAKLVQDQAVSYEVEVRVFYRDAVGIAGAHKQAHEWGAFCVVESHFNAFNGKSIGTEVLASPDKPGSKDFGEIMQRRLCEALQRSGLSRGLKPVEKKDRGGLSVNMYPRTILIEPFFGDVSEEAELAVKHKNEIASAILNAFVEYLNKI